LATLYASLQRPPFSGKKVICLVGFEGAWQGKSLLFNALQQAEVEVTNLVSLSGVLLPGQDQKYRFVF